MSTSLAATLGAALKRLRKSRDLTQPALADELAALGFPVDQSTLSKWEKGKIPPSILNFIAAVQFLREQPALSHDDAFVSLVAYAQAQSVTKVPTASPKGATSTGVSHHDKGVHYARSEQKERGTNAQKGIHSVPPSGELQPGNSEDALDHALHLAERTADSLRALKAAREHVSHARRDRSKGTRDRRRPSK